MAFEWVKKDAEWVGDKFMGNSDYSPEEKQIDTTRADEERALGLETRGQQNQLGDYYQNQLAGKGPSVAQLQLQRGLRQSMATAASGRGTNVALAQRNAANMAVDANRGAAELRAQEQMAAAKQYSDLLQAQRMQDLLARGYSVEEAKAQLAYYGQLQAAKTQAASEQAARGQKALGGLVTAAGTLLAGSDASMKEDIEPVGMGLRPDAVRTSYIDNRGEPAIRTAGGGPAPIQLNNTSGDWYGVGEFSPEQQAAAPAKGAGPSFGQRLGNAFLGLGGGATGNYDPLIQAIKAQQANQEAAKQPALPQQPEKPSGGELSGAALANLGMALSDENSKKEIQSLRRENDSLRQVATDVGAAGGGFLAGGLPGAVAGPVVARGLPVGSPQLLRRGAAQPGRAGAEYASGTTPRALSPEQFKAGIEEFSRLEKENPKLANAVFNQTVPPLDVTQGRAPMHQNAAADYTNRLAQFEKNRADANRDLSRLESAAKLESSRLGTFHQSPETQAQMASRADQARQQIVSDVNAKQVVSDVAAKEPYPSDVRMKQDRMPLAHAMQAHPLADQAAAIPAYKFRYKEPFAQEYGPGPHVGVMAQDLERVPATAPAVQTGTDGLKRVDTGKLAMTEMAMIGDLARRVDEFEKKYSKRTT